MRELIFVDFMDCQSKAELCEFLEYPCVILQDMDKETDCRTAGAIDLLVHPFLVLLSHLKEMHNYAWGLNIEFKLPLIKHKNQLSVSKKFRSSWTFY